MPQERADHLARGLATERTGNFHRIGRRLPLAGEIVVGEIVERVSGVGQTDMHRHAGRRKVDLRGVVRFAGREALARAVGVERDGERARSVGPALGPGGKLLRDGIGLAPARAVARQHDAAPRIGHFFARLIPGGAVVVIHPEADPAVRRVEIGSHEAYLPLIICFADAVGKLLGPVNLLARKGGPPLDLYPAEHDRIAQPVDHRFAHLERDHRRLGHDGQAVVVVGTCRESQRPQGARRKVEFFHLLFI